MGAQVTSAAVAKLRFQFVDASHPTWNSFVSDHPQGTIFHTAEMIQTFAQTKDLPWAQAAIDERGSVVALIVATHVPTVRLLPGRIAARSLWFAEPICEDSPAGRQALEQLIQEHDKYMKRRTLFTEIRAIQDTRVVRPILEACDYEHLDYLNYVVDTKATLDERWKSLSKSCRSKIRKTQKRGVQILLDNTHAGISKMYPLIEETYRRSKVPLAEEELFHAALDCLPEGSVQIRLSVQDANVMAAGIGLVYKDRFFAWYGGSSRTPSLAPFDLLTWDEIRWCVENEIDYYDFGGAGWPDEEYGPRDFKAKFGGELVCFGRYRKVLDPFMLSIAEKGFAALRSFFSP